EELCSLNGNHTPFKCPSDAIPAEKTQPLPEKKHRNLEKDLGQYCCAARRAARKRREKEAATELKLFLSFKEIEEDANLFIDVLEHFRNGENGEETEFDVDFSETEPRINQL
ncbi:hypothetical protein PMAYCL1PPCAC_00555, partial [Pristionchus mayeri]